MRADSRLGWVLSFTVLATAAFGCGDDDGGGPVDAGSDADTVIDGSPACANDDECSDGVFCNGEEVCDDSVCKRGQRVSCDDGVECTTDLCSEESSACRNLPIDFDGDGHADLRCENADGDALGDDCDDENAARYPGNIEVCDGAGLDEDCNTNTVGNKDQDNDGAIDAQCCNTGASGSPSCGTDCDDLKTSVNPSATEVCDLFDNDCDGMTDEEGGVMQYPDTDFDGHGAEGEAAVSRCAGTLGFAVDDDDCDDEDPAVHRAQVEICDEKDNDCDTKIDESPRSVFWYRDRDGDRFGGRLDAALFQCAPPEGYDLRDTDCDDENAAVSPGAAELCDGLDNNCDGLKSARIDTNDFEDDDNDGSADFGCGVTGTDCDDNNSATGGTLLEICDKLDNDCDDKVDEDVADTVWYLDQDGDGFGNERLPAVVYCLPLTGRSAYPGDCNDADPTVNPNAFEVCGEGLFSTGDEDCDGQVDEQDDGFCAVCGDGRPEGPEQCDDRAVNSMGVCVDPDGACNDDSLPDACRTDCRSAHCGDGVVDSGEACDDGQNNSAAPNAACRLDCTLRRCGDHIVDSDEACDDATQFCRPDCTAALWSDGICAPVTSDIAQLIGPNVVSGDTTGGSTALTIDPNYVDTNGNMVEACTFSTDGAPVGPERVYTWTSPADMVYAFGTSNAGLASRLSVALFFNDARYQTSCTEPWACLEPPPNNALVAYVPNAEGVAIAVDSAQGQPFALSIYGLICCQADVDDPVTAVVDSGCANQATELGRQADIDAIIAARASCRTAWDAACVAEAMAQGRCTD